MAERKIVIIGGGVAGVSAGCCALRSGFRATIVEHNLALGGVCTAWQRGPYLVDGCIHRLAGGPRRRIGRQDGRWTSTRRCRGPAPNLPTRLSHSSYEEE
jgi:phytoene dehydrogenase-like protein